MTAGILFVDKPQGPTSHQVVAQARRALGLKKVGHAGTLDPMASGLMTVGVGSSTRLLTFLVGLDKTYHATIRLGCQTVTDDAWGDVLGEPASAAALDSLSEDAIARALEGFSGEIVQRPSAVSAIKVDGKRSYDLVRQGAEVELKERPVTIHSMTAGAIRRSGQWWDVDCEVTCSSGTYIRAIARDVGQVLGVGGHLTALRRTHVGPWSVTQAVGLDDITADALHDPATVIREILPAVSVHDQQAKDLAFGKRIALSHELAVDDEQPVAVMREDGELVAIVKGITGPVRILVGLSGGGESS